MPRSWWRASGDGVRARVGEHRCIERESPVRVTLLQCMARAERMDWIVQKATELGIARIVPIAAAHSVVRVDDAGAARRLAHWRGVAIGACEQCGRNRLPEVQPLRDLPSACREAARSAPAATPADVPRESVRLVLWPDAPVSLPAALAGVAGQGRSAQSGSGDAPELYLLIGPEGGLAQSELEIAHAHGFRACRLGPRILRSETAPLAAIAAIQATLGDFL